MAWPEWPRSSRWLDRRCTGSGRNSNYPSLRPRSGAPERPTPTPTSFGRSATFWPNRRSTARDTERPGRDCAGKAFARASVGSSGSCGRTASLLPRGQVECLGPVFTTGRFHGRSRPDVGHRCDQRPDTRRRHGLGLRGSGSLHCRVRGYPCGQASHAFRGTRADSARRP
jgi:hypothetical protein